MARMTLLALLRKTCPELDKDRAGALISCKNVYVNGELCTDPKQTFVSTGTVEIIYPKYVSRGGLKLEKALEEFDFNTEGLVFLDAGSSTGGFTDCLLKHGAAFVHSVDVGYNLLDFSLRNDSRVAVHEKTNIMHVQDLDPQPDAAVADLSFRSISGAARKVLGLTKQKKMIALIKPQFEVSKGTENFDGVIRDHDLLVSTMKSVFRTLCDEGVGVYGVCASPIRGAKGNNEFLALLAPASPASMTEEQFLEPVEHCRFF